MNIDRIARAMVDVEPSADLEARIRARVREAEPARAAIWWNWRVGAPVAAAAVLALAFAVRTPPVPQVVRSPSLQVTSSAGLPAVAAPAGAVAQAGPQVVSPVGVPESRSSRVRKSRSPVVASATLSAEEIAWMERRMPALDPVNALQMDRLRVDSIQPEPLEITPLIITPVGTDGAG